MKHISLTLARLSTGWLTLAALLLLAGFIAFVLPRQAAEVQRYAGASGSPDVSFLYTPRELYDTAAAYGRQGREAYIRARWTFDLAWPFAYGLFLTTAIGWSFRRAFGPRSGLLRANLLPVAAMLLDYLENASTTLVMARYPATTPFVDWLAPAFSVAKWSALGLSFALLAIGLTSAALRGSRAPR